MSEIYLQNLKILISSLKISNAELGRILNISRQQVGNILAGGSSLSQKHLQTLYEKYNVNLNWLINGLGEMFINKTSLNADAVEIKYLNIPSLMNTIKNPDITSIWLDRELVHLKWKKNEKDLRVIQMPGDTMENEEHTLKDGDILIIDTSINNTQRSGIFVYTTQNDSLIFVNGIKQRPDGSLRFYYLNKTYEDALYSPEKLNEMGFKVIGKLIKDMSIN